MMLLPVEHESQVKKKVYITENKII